MRREQLGPEQLAFKVLLWAGRMRHPTRGGVLEAVEIKAREHGVTDRRVIDRAGQVALEKLNLIR